VDTRIEWPEDQLDYSDSITIKLIKVKFNGEFTHWESSVISSDNELFCDITAPTLGGAIDEAIDYVYDMRHEWTKDDSNKRN
jgi:hypothetical protein